MTLRERLAAKLRQLRKPAPASHGFATLTADQVNDRLRAIGDRPELLPELAAFGDRMLEEQIGRTASIEGKATTILGYSAALFGFLLIAKADTGVRWPDRPVEGAVAALLVGAVVSSFVALRVREWTWFTAHAWMPDAAQLAGLDHLRRHYIQWTYHVIVTLERHNKRKAEALFIAQRLLLVATLALLIGTIVAAL